MSNVTKHSTTCKSVCWLIGMAAGGILTFVLIYQVNSERILSGIAGIVVMLAVGLILRRLVCKTAADEDHDLTYDSAAELAETTATVSRVAKKATEPAAVLAGAAPTAVRTIVRPVAVHAVSAAPEVDFEEAGKTTDVETAPLAPVSDAADAAIIRAVKDAVNPVDHAGDDELAKDLYDWDADEEAEFAALTSAQDEPVKRAVAVIEAVAADVPEIEPAEIVADLAAAAVALDADTVPATQPADLAEIKPMEPKGLEAPEGAADDLTMIDGLRADQQIALNEAGIFHFRQIVGLNRRELAWLKENIPGAATSEGAENWRKQAIQLSRQSG